MSDNFHFDLTDVPLDLCLRVAFGSRPTKAIGWAEYPVKDEGVVPAKVWGAGAGTPGRLVLFRASHSSMVPFPSPMDALQVEPMVRSWLEQAAYGPQPDHDGDNREGWRVYNEAWSHVAGLWEAFVAIEPIWLLLGK